MPSIESSEGLPSQVGIKEFLDLALSCEWQVRGVRSMQNPGLRDVGSGQASLAGWARWISRPDFQVAARSNSG